MKRKFINPLLFIGLIGFFTIGSQFFADVLSVFYGNQDIYWTPRSMKLPIEETNNDFQVFISDKPLKKHLAENTLLAVDQSGKSYPVVSKDVSVRLNNWNKTKSRMLTKAVFTGFGFGIALTCLIIGFIQILIERKKKRALSLAGLV